MLPARLAGWRRERMPEVPDVPAITLAPDWVCEVLSDSTAGKDRSKKLPVFARERVSHVWLVDPEAKSLEIFRLDGESYRLLAAHEADEKVRAAPFDAIELDLAILWAR